MADTVVNAYLVSMLAADIDLLSDTIKGMLLDSNHTTDIDAHKFIDDVSVNEVVGTGYTAGGSTLGSKTLTQDDTLNRGVFDFADILYAGSTITARYLVLYKDTGTPGTSRIVGIYDFVTNKSSSASDFLMQVSASGGLYTSAG